MTRNTFISRLRRFIPGWLALFTIGHFSHHLLTALPVPLLPFIRDDFSLDYARAGLLVSVFSVAYGIAQLPSGWLAGRLGPRLLMGIGICGVGLIGILTGLSAGYTMLLVMMGLMGVLGGGYHPSAPPLVSTTLPPENRGRALGVHAIGGSAAYFVAPLIAAATAAAMGWRSSFLILAAPTLAFGVLLYFLMGRRKTTRTQGEGAGNCQIIERKSGNRANLLAFMALSSIVTILYTALMAFVPLMLVDHFDLSEAAAALFVSIVYFTGIFANPGAGVLSDRIGRIPMLLAAAIIFIPILFFLDRLPAEWGIALGLVIIGCLIAMTQTSSESHIVGNVAEKDCPSVLGVYYFVNMAGAGLVTPFLGALIDGHGLRFSLSVLAFIVAAATAAFIAWLIVRRPSLSAARP
jgi:predicted MFS family arabinose efflux permease